MRPPDPFNTTTGAGARDVSRIAGAVCLIGAIAYMAGIVAAHLGLLTYGAWGADEYATISAYRDKGAAFLWFRFWSWSPRPLSEALIWLYAGAVVSFRQRLIIPALLGFWVLLITAAGPVLPGRARDAIGPRILSAAALLACIVLGRNVAAVLYWPFGAVAYAPVIAAFVFLLFFLANARGMDKDGGLAVMLVTLGAALSSEVGALVVVIYAGLMVLVQTPRAWTDGAVRRRLAWWIVPVLASALVMLMIADNSRSGFPKLPTGDDALYHHPLASLQAALWRFPQEFVALDGETFDRLNFRRGAAVKLLFFLGMHCCWMTTNPEARRGRSRLLVLALALLIAMFGMVAGSYQEFGEPCCDRHGFVRQSLGLIAIAAVAIWLPLTVTALYRWRRFVASCALVGAAYILLHPRVYDMKADYRRYAEPARDRARTEQSAASSGLAMTMYLPYSDQLFPSQIPEGSYAASDNWWTPGILNYFHKQSVTIQFAPSRDAR